MKTSKSILHALLLSAISLLLAVSCKQEPKGGGETAKQCKVTLKMEFPEKVEPETLTLTVTDTRTLKETKQDVDKKSLSAEIMLDAGTYNFSVSGETADKRAIIGKKESVVVKEAMSLTLPLRLGEPPVTDEKCHLIFGDIFFNGETNAQMMHPDQYFMVVNNGDKIEYLDGLCYGITAHANPQPETPWSKFLMEKNELPLSCIYQIPGNGKDYPLEPGKYVIIAATAINHHTEDQPNSVDLSGADFELVFPDAELPNGYKVTDTDNPDVPNLNIIVDAFFGTGIAHPRGFWPPCLFKIKGDIKAFLQQHIMQVKDKNGKLNNFYTIPTDMILDGVETGCEGQFKTRALPATVDQGNFFVTGCHRQQLAHRKTEMRNGRTYWIDTNNSTNDYERVQGQKAYPKK